MSDALDTLVSNKVYKVLQGATKDGTKVEVSLKKGGIDFKINGDYEKGRIPDPIAAGKLVMRLAKQILEELPDNTPIWNIPYMWDEAGEMRLRFYEKMGFGKRIGTYQYAIKKGGKLVPVDKELYEKNIKGREHLLFRPLEV